MSANTSTMSHVKPVDDKMAEEVATFDHLEQQKLTRKVLFKLDARYELDRSKLLRSRFRR